MSVQGAAPFIRHLDVHPAARGRSVGRALLDVLQAWRLRGVSRTVKALSFYRRLG